MKHIEMIGPYQILECINYAATLYKAKTQDGQEICVKQIKNVNRNSDESVRFERERDICKKLKSIGHDNIIKIYDVIERGQEVFLFMEFCPQTLADYIEKENFTYKNYLDLIYQISSGYKKLIELQIIHRDLKLENIVVKMDQQGNPKFKIIDFGTSKFVGEIGQEVKSRATTKCLGTLLYMAPEILDSNIQNYDNSCDIYSFGMVLVIIMCGKNATWKQNWVNNIRQNIEKKSIKKSINVKEGANTKISDIVDCMVTARKWRISWEYLNQRVEQLLQQEEQEEEEKYENNLTTPKKQAHSISFPYQSDLEQTKKKPPQFQQQNGSQNNQYNSVPLNLKYNNQRNNLNFQFIEGNKNQFQQQVVQTDRPSEFQQPNQQQLHNYTEPNPMVPNFLKNPLQFQNLINQQKQQVVNPQPVQNNPNFQKQATQTDKQIQEKVDQKINIQAQQDQQKNGVYYQPSHLQKAQQQNKIKQNFSLINLNQERQSIQNQSSFVANPHIKSQIKTLQRKP